MARFPYLPRFRNFDFLYATVDVAIWSAVEQGLAITAGCLATLRPLLKEIGYRLGWTKPSNYSGGPTSGRAQQSSGQVNVSGRSKNRDMYDLSEFAQLGDDESIIQKQLKGGKQDARASIMGGFRSPTFGGMAEKRGSVKVTTLCEKNESQEELRDQQSKNIMVSKDFLVISDWK